MKLCLACDLAMRKMPCVAGIDRATSILNDGQVVEIDGESGIVRLVA